MSSFLVYYSKQKNILTPEFFNDFSKVEFNNFFILYKDNPNTLTYNFGKSIKYIISGLGISEKNSPRFYTNAEWETLVSNTGDFVTKINGHFAGCILKENKLICFNDILGLRDLYYAQNEERVIVSSSYHLFKEFEIDLNLSEEYVGGMWTTSIPPFYKTPFKEIKRLGPGGKIEFTEFNSPVTSNYKFNFESTEENEVYNRLKSFTLIKHPLKKFSLGLSGGLDSRTLLSMLLNSKTKIAAHTFGSNKLADVQIAKTIAALQKIELKEYDNFLPSVDNIISLVNTHIPFSGLTIPISDLVHIHYHEHIDSSGYGIVDGGFGEIGRRQFMNRFLLRGRKIISRQNTNAFISNLKINKGDFFSDDFNDRMNKSLSANTEFLWSNMGDIPQEDIQLWLDVFAVKFKLPNIYSYGQHTLDQIAVAYMPFAQPDILKTILTLPTKNKTNGKLYRKIISQEKPDLKKINLVKDYVEYPFSLGTVSSHLVRKMKSKYTSVSKVDPIKHRMYDNLKEYLGDEINSNFVKENNCYNSKKIEMLFDEYYSGNKSRLAELDWWLTFNEWYKVMFGC